MYPGLHSEQSKDYILEGKQEVQLGWEDSVQI